MFYTSDKNQKYVLKYLIMQITHTSTWFSKWMVIVEQPGYTNDGNKQSTNAGTDSWQPDAGTKAQDYYRQIHV